MILEKIAAHTRARIAPLIAQTGALREQALSLPIHRLAFSRALSIPGMSFICEVKRASPSKGVIAEDFPYEAIAREYEAAGAAALSVLTEPEFFLGRDEYLRTIAQKARIPALRKDFTLHECQIYQAKLLGASAILLIAALLDTATIAKYLSIAHELGLCALVEAHTREELRSARTAGARIIGVNNRDLHTFTVDLGTTLRLRELAPPSVLFVSESGIRTPEDIAALRAAGVDAVLIGETLMRAPDKRAALASLREGSHD